MFGFLKRDKPLRKITIRYLDIMNGPSEGNIRRDDEFRVYSTGAPDEQLFSVEYDGRNVVTIRQCTPFLTMNLTQKLAMQKWLAQELNDADVDCTAFPAEQDRSNTTKGG